LGESFIRCEVLPGHPSELTHLQPAIPPTIQTIRYPLCHPSHCNQSKDFTSQKDGLTLRGGKPLAPHPILFSPSQFSGPDFCKILELPFLSGIYCFFGDTCPYRYFPGRTFAKH